MFVGYSFFFMKPASQLQRHALLPGNTPSRNITALAKHFGVQQLLVKDESENPFGTQKDRKSWCVLAEAKSRGAAGLCILTAGNAGLSLASMAAESGLRVVAIVSNHLPDVAERLKKVCSEVVSIDLRNRRWTAKELQTVAGDRPDHPILDATNRIYPYKQVGIEIAQNPPGHLVVPVGGGELLLGIANSFRQAGITTRLWGVTIKDKNSIADKLYAPWTPYMRRIRLMTSPPSPHRLIELVSDEPIAAAFQEVRKHLTCEPSSAASFAALSQVEAKRSESVMVVNTGRFLFRPEMD